MQLQKVITEAVDGRTDNEVDVAFEPHMSITKDDRAEIFELILDDLIHDDEKSEKLKDRANIMLLSDDLNFDLPQIPNVRISTLDEHKIQEIADVKGRVIYLIFRPFVIEGSQVLARMSLRDKVARRSGMHVPYGYTFLFTLAKKDRQWMIEKSIGYAQSVGYSK